MPARVVSGNIIPITGSRLASLRSSRRIASNSRVKYLKKADFESVFCDSLIDAKVPALKEWDVSVAALHDGEQTVLLRKGGIKEPTFVPRAGTFLVFPGAFHSEAGLLQEEAQAKYGALLAAGVEEAPGALEFTTACQVTGVWATMDAEGVLGATARHHIYGERFVEKRLRWRPQQNVTVVEVRAFRLPRPLRVPRRDEYSGCFSWIALSEEDAMTDMDALLGPAVPAVDDETFRKRQLGLRTALQQVPGVQCLYDGQLSWWSS